MVITTQQIVDGQPLPNKHTTAEKGKTHDTHCRKPLCIRHITRQQQTGDYRFEVEWHTSAGIIKTVGWRWLRAYNRIVAPTCQRHHIFKLPPTVRASIRRLFTEIMQAKGITIPPINVKKVRTNSENLLPRQTPSEFTEVGSFAGYAAEVRVVERPNCLIKGSQDGETEEPGEDS